MKDTTKQNRTQQQLNIALGIIKELLQHISEDSSNDTYQARLRAENFLKVMEGVRQ